MLSFVDLLHPFSLLTIWYKKIILVSRCSFLEIGSSVVPVGFSVSLCLLSNFSVQLPVFLKVGMLGLLPFMHHVQTLI